MDNNNEKFDNKNNINMGRVDPEKIVNNNEYSNYVKHKRSWVKTLFFILSVIFLSFIIAYFILIFTSDFMGIGKPYKESQIDIPTGGNTADISSILKENEIIKYPGLFKLISKISGNDGKYHHGIYTFSSNMPYFDIMDALKIPSSKQSNVVRITFKEGETLNKYAKLLEDNKVCSAESFINTINSTDLNYWFIKEVTNNPYKYNKMEGFAFPNTYDFLIGEDPKSVVKKFLSEFNNQFTSDMVKRMNELGLSLQDTITLASIVQGEAGDPKEMTKVASVFYNRLNNAEVFPKLQSDPTKNYVRDDIKPNLIPANQDIYKAYDTYESKGIPPGAINNPGIDAINAVLYPSKTPYYYFASNLNTREFFYAVTLEEHEQNLFKAGLK